MKSKAEGRKKVALVTGASRGIGLAIVKRFKDAGYQVAACSRTKAIRSAPGVDLPFECDVADPKAVEKFVRAVRARYRWIDVVVNNAGQAGTNPLERRASDELWHRILGTNLNGTYYVCKQALEAIPDGGRIINIASVLALKGVPDQTAYCAAKHGVLGLTRALAHHVAPRRITVNAICPGWVRTEMARGRMKELQLTEKSLKAGVPLGRFVEPEEVADLALYLASEAGSGITGQALTLDGGVMA
jgi:NAD(P)-dependent dehydrogenase (short-subunit alcohol dehydrogenase family)